MMPPRSRREPTYRAMRLPPRRKLDELAVIDWLRQGVACFNRVPILSLAYGGLFAAVGALITWLGLGWPQFILAFWTGFLLVGPLLAMGLYRAAHLLERNDSVSLGTCWSTLRARLGKVVLFTLLPAIVMIAWVRFSTLAATLYVDNVVSTPGYIAALGTTDNIGFIVLLFGVGAVFAVIMFALTAWSLPMMLDGRADFGTAVVASVKATFEQPRPMLTWAAAVTGLSIVGMLTFFVGFVVIFPLLGFATWAGYRDLFGQDAP